MNYQPYLDAAVRAARVSGELIMRYYAANVSVETKADKTPVTVADREAEELIRQELSTAFPDHGFLGEEGGEDRGDREFVWVIDPIDGTMNFIHQIPLFATEIALMRGDTIVVGVSHCPGMNELLTGIRDVGAWRNDQPIRVSDVRQLCDGQVTNGGLAAFAALSYGEAALKVATACRRDRGIGDAYAYHLVASGRMEAVIEAEIRIWDIAALTCIVEAAGGRVTTLDGLPVTREIRTIAASNGHVHDEVVRHFA